LPVEIAGENRLWRTLSIDAIKADPLWKDGNYTDTAAVGPCAPPRR
jgi:homoserine O-acetyltransferase